VRLGALMLDLLVRSQQLIAVVPDPMALVAEVERGLSDLPADAAELWRTIADRARG